MMRWVELVYIANKRRANWDCKWSEYVFVASLRYEITYCVECTSTFLDLYIASTVRTPFANFDRLVKVSWILHAIYSHLIWLIRNHFVSQTRSKAKVLECNSQKSNGRITQFSNRKFSILISGFIYRCTALLGFSSLSYVPEATYTAGTSTLLFLKENGRKEVSESLVVLVQEIWILPWISVLFLRYDKISIHTFQFYEGIRGLDRFDWLEWGSNMQKNLN